MMTTVSALAMTFWLEESGALQLIGTTETVHAGTITVTQFRSDLGVAPEMHVFQVTGWSGFDTPAPSSGNFDARLHDFDYLWDFDDPGSTFGPFRLVSAFQNANVGYGADVAHRYGPGTGYAPSCLVIERSSGKTALWTATPFDVADPDTFFSGNTLTVDPDGGADYTTLAAAMAATKGQTTPKRITLARAKTHTVSSAIGMAGSYWPNVYICSASGAGAKATINYTGTSAGLFDNCRTMNRATVDDVLDFVLSDLNFTGPWDATREEGLTTIDHYIGDFLEDTANRALPMGNPEYLMVDGCDMSGFASFFMFQAATKNHRQPRAYMANCTGTNWMDYAFFGSPKHFVALGTEFSQPSDAISGGAKDGKHNNHGVCRLGADITVLDGNDWTSKTGWFGNTIGYNTIQSVFRLFSDGGQIDGTERANTRRCVSEGDFAITDANNGNGPKTINCIVAQNLIIGHHMLIDALCTIQWGGVTVENNLFIIPNTANIAPATYNFKGAVKLREVSLSTANDLGRIAVRHNSVHNMRTTANGGQPSDDGIIDDQMNVAQAAVVNEHNIYHAPNLNTPVTTFAPLTFANTITPKITGYQRRREVFTGTLAGNVANGASFTVDYVDGDFGDGGASSWQSGGAHTNSLGTSTYSFGASSATITNASGSTWTSGSSYTIQLERNPDNLPAFDTSLATPASNLGIITPGTGSIAIGGAATTFPRFDAISGNRKTIIDALTRTAATDGAVEVALES